MDQPHDPESLAANNVKLAYYLARRWAPVYRLDQEEAEQTAIEALVKAANSFNPEVSKNFAGLASAYIRNSLRHLARPMRGEPMQRVNLDAPVGDEEGDASGHDIVSAASTKPAGELDRSKTFDLLIQGLDQIKKPRDREIINRWLHGETYRDIAADSGISFVYVGKIVQGGLAVLKQWMEKHGVTPSSMSEALERIRSAAIRVNGHIVEGPMHLMAIETAANQGYLSEYGVYDFDDVIQQISGNELEEFGIEDGFTTTAGRFVDREEAARIAKSAEQVGSSYNRPGGLDSVHVRSTSELAQNPSSRLGQPVAA